MRTFDTFVVSEGSRSAWTLAREFASAPRAGKALVLCGPTGCGKSHLLHAIAHDTGWRVLSGDQWKMMLATEARTGKSGPRPEALLVDDLAITPAIVLSVAHLVQRDVPFVLTCLAPPPLDDAVIVRMDYPDLEARIEIARREAARRNLSMSDGELRALAKACSGNPREMQSAIAQLAFTPAAPPATPSTGRQPS